MSTDPRALNRALSRINLVTSLGDFVSLFAVLVLMHDQTGRIELAAYAIPLKALGIALGGAVFPWVLSVFPLRTLMIGTQLNSALSMALIAILAYLGAPPWPIYALLVAQTVLKQLFDGAREAYSKSLGTPHVSKGRFRRSFCTRFRARRSLGRF